MANNRSTIILRDPGFHVHRMGAMLKFPSGWVGGGGGGGVLSPSVG